MANTLGYLILDGTQLTATGVTVKRTEQSSSHRVRRSFEDLHGGGQVHEKTGLDMQTVQITFKFFGRGQAKWTTRELVRGILTSRDNWLLEAPVSQYIINDKQSGVFATSGDVTLSEEEGLGRISLRVQAIYEGSPVADGGTFSGQFNASMTFLDNDFYSATNAAGLAGDTLIGLPAQVAGYPRGVSATSPFPTQSLTAKWHLVAAGDDQEGIVTVYDATDYFFTEPFTEGNGGPGTFFEAPSGVTYSDLVYANVATVTNDFGITSSSAPFLLGVVGGASGSILHGPPGFTASSTWTLTAAGDATTATVTILRTTGNDGVYIGDVA